MSTNRIRRVIFAVAVLLIWVGLGAAPATALRVGTLSPEYPLRFADPFAGQMNSIR